MYSTNMCEVKGYGVLDAVYQDHASPLTSKRYQFFPTSLVLDTMRNNGYSPTRMLGLTKRAKSPEYGKHLITFRKEGEVVQHGDDGVHEFVFVNSHNRTSSAQFFHGYFRWACSNGCIFGKFADKTSIHHTTNNPVEDLMALIQHGVDTIGDKIKTIALMQQTYLNRDEMEEFAVRASVLRDVIDHRQLLYIDREADMGSDLWKVYNRAQEALMRGKFERWNPERNTYRKARPVNNIGETTRINTQLFSIATEYLEA